MASLENFQTKSGLTPDEKELPYSIRTEDVKNFLQLKVNGILKQMRMVEGGENEPDHIDVNVYTTDAGRSFFPFIVILPTSVLKESEEQKRRNKPAMFQSPEYKKSTSMKKPLYNLFSAYIYNKKDEDAFFSDDWRRARGVTRQTSPVLKGQRTPKVTTLNNGRMKVVIFMIDPIRVFHDMLKVNTDNRDFFIEITDWKKIRTGEYVYYVKRTIAKNNGKGGRYKNTIPDELNRKLRNNH